MSQYSADISKPINFLPVNIAIFAVVPLPQNGSRTTSPLFDQDKMWSFAKRSGNTAGCFVLFNPLATSHTLKRLEYSLTTLFLDKVRRCSLPHYHHPRAALRAVFCFVFLWFFANATYASI